MYTKDGVEDTKRVHIWAQKPKFYLYYLGTAWKGKYFPVTVQFSFFRGPKEPNYF